MLPAGCCSHGLANPLSFSLIHVPSWLCFVSPMLLYKGKWFLALKHGQLVTNASVLFSNSVSMKVGQLALGTWSSF
jgi:hypothetical protein